MAWGLQPVPAAMTPTAQAMTRIMLAVFLAACAQQSFADRDRPTKFSNQGSVANTRHNMTQRQPAGGGPSGDVMQPYRNDYGEVCVYCHTPHAASPGRPALWNHTIEARPYTLYGANSATLTQPVTQPGFNSLACLSCHDGQTAIDSIVNMPGSGRYQASQAGSVDTGFLDRWTNAGPQTFVHANLTECMSCHAANAGVVGAGATAFEAFNLGTDLSNDHPVGVAFPLGNPDYKEPKAVRANLRFFDSNGNGRADKDEIRLYRAGDVYEVECASCHDPHGVPGGDGKFNATFLRVNNAGSGVCLTCHSK